ncbi:Cobyric acid synthase [Photobacterium damselae subsp. piscicida]|uniref:Cobyric acid synthase n=1 Tax=Photobacterium damsela subsp. piscicida TaxID=38294 RepID=A0A1V1VEF5_PHODP|nr:cobyric acid synthase [Photobacterium damselae]MBE8126963.1 cobyric acid synthase [Photobacterium damselae subsp. piscicida]PSV59307.1 cobyric acid synthase [Photobacterium damselae]PSW76066.1 cobyric acid synthase [Photobacterium damselae]QOD54259.1 cobyric acid synthase [Photobacterium damselae subsp. piscicida]QOD58475.1 cobyric acid synthase [Photobacterium damselae subsp. piscicida]
MVQGTTSDAGKSVLVAGLCRVLARKGIAVAPFKSQNMALNSAVTQDGGEIGRAQAVQAQACRIEPTVDMNPVLLKPNTDIGAQVIVQGKALADMDAVGYHNYKKVVMGPIMDSFAKLQAQYQTVVIEGAGSPAEINLRENDVANMGFAEKADVPVIIIADIDRGGVFAHLYGTLALLSESEQNRVKGFVINRFRGDIKLLESGLDWLEQKTGKLVLGVLPYLHGLMLEAEDAINSQQVESTTDQPLRVAVPVLTRVSNHTDFDPLRMHPQVNLMLVGKGEPLPPCDLVIIPGTKNVRDDLAYLKEQGWDQQIQRHLRLGGKLMGICGGYQMLGQTIADPLGIEGKAGESQGLGYLDVTTVLEQEKQLKQVSGTLTLPNQASVPVRGYEIHAGVTTGVQVDAPIQLESGLDGQLGVDNQVFGTYLHGIFERQEACDAILSWAGLEATQTPDFDQIREQGIDRVADTIEQYLDLEALWPEWDLFKK